MMSQDMLIAITALLGLIITVSALLRGWQGWLALKTRELDSRHAPHRPAESREIETRGNGMGRIEIADLRERIRKLEAIASGVDL